ncbi:hypothetical protein CBR_g40203 [Chara braunii]|uniref:Integrase catalytic domain-containing protein n=1 Tax=Chara braunii TaxID=69332 RepID=A0A388LTI1_CHABU|nr:hypothetical protein CBR_g40203 [Chara braunii]|eukprot:GBG85565.1 hypothetical protein CBR_g40203 [Chara braunii]
MATEDKTGNHESEGEPGLGGSAEQSKEGQKDRESANPNGTKGNQKEMSSGESSGKVGGSRQGTQENKEGRNKDRASPGNSEGAVSKKVRVTDARCKLAEIEKRTAEYKARLIEEMMIGNEEGPLQAVPRDERKTSRDGTRQGDKGSDRGGTPSKRRKERENSPGMEAKKATTPPAMDSRASRLPITPAVARGCEGLWSLRERVLGWFDPEGTMKTREGQKADKESPDNSVAGEASSSEGGLKKIVSSLARALNKNQGYLADAKKKLTFDGANITEFLIDYENLVALLKWTKEEKIDHLGQHVVKPRTGHNGHCSRKPVLEEDPGCDDEEVPSGRENGNGGRPSGSSKEELRNASPRLLKGLRQLLTQRRVEIGDNPELPEGEREQEAPQEVANLQRSHGDLEDLEKAFADIRLSLPDREGGEVMRSSPGTKLSFHALSVGKLKIQIGSHHTDALVDGGEEITLIRRDFATITGCTVNKEVTGSIRGAGGEIPFAGYILDARDNLSGFVEAVVLKKKTGRSVADWIEDFYLYRYILDARDNLSGFVEAVALKKKMGRSVVDWIEDFYLRHPFVRRFIADNGTEFVNQEVLGMLKRLCVPIKLIESYHAEANAPMERGHRTLKNTIAKLAADHLGNWPRCLKQAVFAENMTPKRTTGCIPAELWYGREIDFPVEALVPTWNRLDDDPQMTTEELIEARCQQILKNEEVIEDIANRVLDSRMRDQARWDQIKNVRKELLQVGEMVLLRNSALESTWSGQLGKRFKGPYRVAM